jgi:hypothetical protein
MWNWVLQLLLYIYKGLRQFRKCLRNMRTESVQLFLVLPTGEERPVEDTCTGCSLLAKFHTNAGVRYRFVERPTLPYVPVFVAPEKKLLGLSVVVAGKSYSIEADEFNVGSNTLFTPAFNRWLCRNYLGIAVSEEVEATVIDADVNVTCSKGPLYLK